MLTIYTDGACSGNPGKGGWAAIIIENGSRKEIHGAVSQTTNNRMELLAVIKGLESVPESSTVAVHSDSQYVINTMTRNWKRKANGDLWAMLDTEVNKRSVKWEWVRGHSGVELNEEADRLATKEASASTNQHPSNQLSHTNKSGQAHMVNVGPKQPTLRVAVAEGYVELNPKTMELVRKNDTKKGDVLSVARIAGIMAAKRTSDLIPLCHAIPVDQALVEFTFDDKRNAIGITATVKTTAKTGVEMEALTAVSVSALTIYDMCKSVDQAIRIEDIRLIKKSGGTRKMLLE